MQRSRVAPSLSAIAIGLNSGTTGASQGYSSKSKLPEDKKAGSWKLRHAAYCIPKNTSFPLDKAAHIVRLDCCGEDSYSIAENEWQTVLAVADGVGGWRSKGVDPSAFSRSLMRNMEAVVRDEPLEGEGVFAKLWGKGGTRESPPTATGPVAAGDILKRAFWRMIRAFYAGKDKPFGSSTACVVSVTKEDGLLDTANLGDSGFLLIRKSSAPSDRGKIILCSTSQQHRFNAPYQATLTPEGNVMDTTASAARQSCQLQAGDLLILATDGLWDNLFQDDILAIVHDRSLLCGDNRGKEEEISKELVTQARRMSERGDYESPFCVEGARHGQFRRGGKMDDITVIVASVEYLSGATREINKEP